MGPKTGTILVKLQDQSGHTISNTFEANPTGISKTSELNIANASFIEGTIFVTAQYTDTRGKIQPTFSGTNAYFDKTAPKLVSIIAGISGVGAKGLDTSNDAVIFESKERIIFTDISGVLKNYTDPSADIGDGKGETSLFLQALDRDLSFNSSAYGSGVAGTWGLKSNTIGADVDIELGWHNTYFALSLVYKNIGSSGFETNVLNDTYQYLIPNPNSTTVTITDLAGNRLSTNDAGSPKAVDYDDKTDVDVTDQ